MTALPRFVTIAAALTMCGAAFAESHVDRATLGAIKARQSHMQLLSFNLGPLGAMAQEKMDYDAELATEAATNLAAVTALAQDRYWPEGSSNAEIEETRALPAIWEDPTDYQANVETLMMAAQELSAAAGGGLEGLQAAFGPVGKACGGCHETYRQPND